MTVSLALAFGGMMVLALGIVLTGSFTTATKNTRDLLVVQTDMLLDSLTQAVQQLLRPSEGALEQAAEMLLRYQGEPDRLDAAITGIVAALPQLAGIAKVWPDGRLQVLGDVPTDNNIAAEATFDALMSELADHTTGEVYWSNPIWSQLLQETVLSARLPLGPEYGGPVALLTGVKIDVMADLLNTLEADIGQQVFVLHGRNHVIAHTGFSASDYDLGQHMPLPEIASVNDRFLRKIWSPDVEQMDLLDGRIDGEARFAVIDDVEIGFLFRQIHEFANLPWIVGIHIDLRSASDEITRLMRSAIMATIISFVAVLITLWIGNRLSKPIERLAQRAQALQSLETSALPALPGSRITELDQANQAFNAMAGALRWFGTYLPKRLVSQLINQGSPDEVTSEEREVTIMFTDIVTFSARTRMMSPIETAAFLNEHFDILEDCITAEDGLIDKFIGDSVMAFWGAPQDQPDHASRAISAALRMRQELEAGDIAIRVGIHTGKVLVGNIGASERLNYTIVGDAVNIAQRIEQHGKVVDTGDKVTILASQTTIARSELIGKNVGAPVLRGQNIPIELVKL